MCSNQNNRRRCNKCGLVMFYFYWNNFKRFFKILCNLKLNLLLWVGCFVLAIVILVMSQHRTVVNKETPTIVWWTKGFPGPKDDLRACENHLCYVTSVKNITNGDKAYLFYGSQINFDNLPLPRNPSDIWGLYHEESPRNVEYFMHEKALTLFNYSSTFSRYSDVPFVLQYLGSLSDLTSVEYLLTTTEKNSLSKEISPVLYLQTDCETTTERDEYVSELMKHIPVDSYGACLNNKGLPEKFKSNYLNNLDEREFVKFVARYKFTIAIENAVCEDYITEKFWRALKVGSVPLYFGSPSIQDWMPNTASAILLQDYQTPAELANYLNMLLDNDILYEKHLEHKTKNIVSNQRLIKEFSSRPYVSDALFTTDEFECFVCRKLYERKREGFQGSVVSKRHYDCPKPLSALSARPNEENSWVMSWASAKKELDQVYAKIMNAQ